MLNRRGFVGALCAATAIGLAAAAPLTSTASAGPALRTGLAAHALQAIPVGCAGPVDVGASHCFAKALGLHGTPRATAAPSSGYGPPDIQSAYGLSGLNGAGRTVAIVDAYDDKSAEADLAAYRSAWGLPACTTANGCFKKVNQSGVQGSYPKNNTGWAVEISLDLDAVSAACPSCHILLVEATNNQNSSLYAAVDTAARLGAVVISNSYGGSESST